VISEITKYNLNIVILQEVRWLGNGSIKHKETRTFYSEYKENIHAFIVEFMINNSLVVNVKRFEVVRVNMFHMF
jgi:hypothetical protein